MAVLLFVIFAGVTFMPNSQRALENSALTVGQSLPLLYKLPGYFASMFAGVLVMTRPKLLAIKFLDNKWIVLALSLVFLSVVWSQEPLQSLKTGAFLLLSTATAIWFSEEFTTAQQMEVVMIVGLCCAALSLSELVVAPDLAYGLTDPTALQGVFYSKNHCGRMMLFLLLPALHYPWRIRFLKWIYIVFVLLVVGLSKSSTAWILTVAYGMYVLVIKFLQILNRSSRRLVAVFFAVAGCSMVTLAAINLDTISRLAGKDMVLTGRPLIWKALFASAIKKPLLGYGYDAFWTGESGEGFSVVATLHSAFGFTGMYAHNGYLDVLLQLGFVGVLVILISLIRGVKLGWFCLSRASNLGAITWYLGIIILSAFYNIVEVTFLLPKYLPWMMYIFASIGLSDEMGRIRRLPKPDTIQVAA